MQTSVRKACFQFPECSLSYAKITQGECNSKTGKRSFTRLDTAEPQPVICNDNANEGNESLLSYCRVQLIIYNDSARRVQQQGGKTEFSQT